MFVNFFFILIKRWKVEKETKVRAITVPRGFSTVPCSYLPVRQPNKFRNQNHYEFKNVWRARYRRLKSCFSDPYSSGFGSRHFAEYGSESGITLMLNPDPVLRIRDVYPGSRIRLFSIPDPGSRIRTVSIPDPGSRILIKECKYFNPSKKQKKWFLSSKKYDPGCSSRIPDPDADFLPSRIPDPGSRGQKGTQSRIPDPDPQHCPDPIRTQTTV